MFADGCRRRAMPRRYQAVREIAPVAAAAAAALCLMRAPPRALDAYCH